MSEHMTCIEVVNTSISNPFTNSKDYDVVFYSTKSNHTIHIGCQSNNTSQAPSMIQMSTSNVVIQGALIPLGISSASNIVGSNMTCSNITVGAFISSTFCGSNMVASNITSSNVSSSNINTNIFQTSGTVRISDKGHLSNVSACNGSNVTIDASCLMGILPLARGGTGMSVAGTTGTNNLVFSTSPTLTNPTSTGTLSASNMYATSLFATSISAPLLAATTSIVTPAINVASRGALKFDFGVYTGYDSAGTISFNTLFTTPPIVTTCPNAVANWSMFGVGVRSTTTTSFFFQGYDIAWNSSHVVQTTHYAVVPFSWAAIGI